MRGFHVLGTKYTDHAFVLTIFMGIEEKKLPKCDSLIFYCSSRINLQSNRFLYSLVILNLVINFGNNTATNDKVS